MATTTRWQYIRAPRSHRHAGRLYRFPVAEPGEKVILQAPWAAPLYEPKRYKVLYGGRGSGKTWAIGNALIDLASQRPLRICVGREHLKSISESAKPVLEKMIQRRGLAGPGGFRITKYGIDHANGSHFLFIGLAKISEEDIRGLESVDIFWGEEAHRISLASWVLLRPTIRKPGSEIWLSFNPKYRYDPVFIDFIARSNPRAWIRQVNFDENLWFPDELDDERLDDLTHAAERYQHTWLGQPDDASDAQKVLPYELLRKCVVAWPLRPRDPGLLHVGFDLADTGIDMNALVGRCGPCITDVQEWTGQASTIGRSTRRADTYCREQQARILSYDAGGIGAGIRSELANLGRRPYGARGEHFNGAILGPDTLYTMGTNPILNKNFFHQRNAQMGWTLRLRAHITVKLLDKVPGADPYKALFIDPKLPDLEAFLAQLSQPEWNDDTGKIRINKRPAPAGVPKPPSPDKYDAAVLAFAPDSRRGLRRPK